MKENKSVSHSVVSDSATPGTIEPARLFCPWNSPGKNTGAGLSWWLSGKEPTCQCRRHGLNP